MRYKKILLVSLAVLIILIVSFLSLVFYDVMKNNEVKEPYIINGKVSFDYMKAHNIDLYLVYNQGKYYNYTKEEYKELEEKQKK